ncbi:MAG: hypothetical protein HY400_00170 [Elusimicrobia bacterium]|nr:hypothetical protein [Elusimicrobiota bacterium]
MKIVSWVLGLSLLVPFLGLADQGHEHGKAAGMTTLVGEVLDLNCYVPHEGQGKEHSKCAIKCIVAGAPVGLLVEGKVYLLIGKDHDMNLAKMLGPFGGQNAKVSGALTEKGGVRFFIVHKVEKP